MIKVATPHDSPPPPWWAGAGDFVGAALCDDVAWCVEAGLGFWTTPEASRIIFTVYFLV